MLGRKVGSSIALYGDEHVFGSILELLLNADEVIANLESPFSSGMNKVKYKDPHLTFSVNPEMVRSLKYLNVSGVSLANNHLGDDQINGILSNAEVLKNAKIKYTGAGLNSEDALKPIVIFDKDVNQSIGLFSFNAFVPYTKPAKKNSYGVIRFDKKNVSRAIQKEGKDLDHIILLLHWGIDYHYFPVPRLLNLVKQIITDNPKIIAVVGHHPHLQQPLIYHNDIPIFCSLGNFVFDEPFPLSRIGSVLSVQIDSGRIVHNEQTFTSLTDDYRVVPMTKDEIGEELSRLSFVKQKIENNDEEWLRMDRKWIRVLLYQFLRFGSLNDLSYLLQLYSFKEIIRALIHR